MAKLIEFTINYAVVARMLCRKQFWTTALRRPPTPTSQPPKSVSKNYYGNFCNFTNFFGTTTATGNSSWQNAYPTYTAICHTCQPRVAIYCPPLLSLTVQYVYGCNYCFDAKRPNDWIYVSLAGKQLSPKNRGGERAIGVREKKTENEIIETDKSYTTTVAEGRTMTISYIYRKKKLLHRKLPIFII